MGFALPARVVTGVSGRIASGRFSIDSRACDVEAVATMRNSLGLCVALAAALGCSSSGIVGDWQQASVSQQSTCTTLAPYTAGSVAIGLGPPLDVLGTVALGVFRLSDGGLIGEDNGYSTLNASLAYPIAVVDGGVGLAEGVPLPLTTYLDQDGGSCAISVTSVTLVPVAEGLECVETFSVVCGGLPTCQITTESVCKSAGTACTQPDCPGGVPLPPI